MAIRVAGKLALCTTLLALSSWDHAVARPMADEIPTLDFTGMSDGSVVHLDRTMLQEAHFRLGKGVRLMVTTKETFEETTCPRRIPLKQARDIVKLAYQRANFIDMLGDEENSRVVIDPDNKADQWLLEWKKSEDHHAPMETVAQAQQRITELNSTADSLLSKLAITTDEELAETILFPEDVGRALRKEVGRVHDSRVRGKSEEHLVLETSFRDDKPGTVLYFISTSCHRAVVTVKEVPRATCPTGSGATAAAAASASVLPEPTELERIVKTFAGSGPTESEEDLMGDGHRAHLEKQHPESPVRASRAEFSFPTGIVTDAEGNIYLANTGADFLENEYSNDWLAKLSPLGVTSHVAGGYQGYSDGNSSEAKFRRMGGLAYHAAKDVVFIADASNHMIRALEKGDIKSVVGVDVPPAGHEGGFEDGDGDTARFDNPQGLAYDAQEDVLYVADTDNHRIRKIDLAQGTVSTLSGGSQPGSTNGPVASASFHHPTGLAFDATRRILYVSDTMNHVIRYITLSSGTVQTLVGVGRPGTCDGDVSVAAFEAPEGMWHDTVQNVLYVADPMAHRIRAVAAVGHPKEGTTTTFAGSSFGLVDGVGTKSSFAMPTHVAGNVDKRLLYVSDHGNHRVRRITLDGFEGDPIPHDTEL